MNQKDFVRDWAEKLYRKVYGDADDLVKIESAARELLALQREEDAKVCEEMPCDCCWHEDARIMADTCAAAIRKGE